MSDNLDKLNSFLELTDDWNGYGASAISPDLVSNMRGLVLTLCRQPEIFPTAQDSIQFEYEKENGEYLEFEMFEDGPIKVFSTDCEGHEFTDYVDFDAQQINEAVRRFYE